MNCYQSRLPLGLNNTPCIQNKRWMIIHADDILPEHICTVIGRWVRHLWLILLFCKLNYSKPCTHMLLKLPPNMFSLCYPSRNVSTPRHWRSVRSSDGANRYLQGAFAAPWDGAAAVCFSGRLRYGGISVVDHTHCKSRLLQSHWVMATFCCPGAFHTPDYRTQLYRQLSALCSYLSTHPGASRRALLAPLLKQALTPRIFTHFSLYFTFIWLSSPLHIPQFILICLSFSQTTSALILISFKTHLFSPFFGLPSALSRRDHAQKMDVFQNSLQK